MDLSATGGLTVSVIGLATVFTALMVLVATVSTTGRWVDRSQSLRAAAPGPDAAPSKLEADSVVDLRAVAVAAFAAHLRRRAVTRPPSMAISRWSIAGRLRQLAPFQR